MQAGKDPPASPEGSTWKSQLTSAEKRGKRKRETKISKALEEDLLVNSKGPQDLGVNMRLVAFLRTDPEGCEQGCDSLQPPQQTCWRHKGFNWSTWSLAGDEEHADQGLRGCCPLAKTLFHFI